jgi:hypothetical protein
MTIVGACPSRMLPQLNAPSRETRASMVGDTILPGGDKRDGVKGAVIRGLSRIGARRSVFNRTGARYNSIPLDRMRGEGPSSDAGHGSRGPGVKDSCGIPKRPLNMLSTR